MNLLDLAIKVAIDDSEVDSGLKDVESKTTSFASKIGKGFAATAAVGTAVVATTTKMGKALYDNVSSVAEYGDNIDKMSQKMGISAEAYQEWDAVMQHSGTSIEALKPSMKTLAQQAEKGSDAFQKLGISEEQVASMSQEDLFSAVITGLQNMEEGTERTALTAELLGRGATELGALLNTSAEETQAMKDRVHELGGVMSDEAVKNAAAFQDQLQDLQTGFQSLSRNLMTEFLPSITDVMGGLTEIFTGNFDEGIDQISLAFDSIIASLVEKLPQIIDVATKIILALVEAIINNLPKIMEAGIEIIFGLIDGITQALPDLIPAIVTAILIIVEKLTEPDTLMQLIQAAFQIIGALAQGLINAIPELVKHIPTIIMNLVQALIQAAPQILASGVQLMVELGLGILQGAVEVVNAVVEVFGKAKEGFTNRIKDAATWGRDLITNFINGIKQKWNDLKSTMSNLAGTVKSYIGFSEPETGPLSNFHTYAPDMMELFAQGIKDNTDLITDQIGKSFDFSNDITGGNMDMQSAQTPTEGGTAISDAWAQVISLLQIIANKDISVSSNGIFTMVRDQNDIYKKANGVGAL